MEFYQLAQFREIAECESVSQAAARLHTSQPALSAMLKKLEAELHVQLFDRTKNRIVLNEAGALALRHAKRLLEQAEQISFHGSSLIFSVYILTQKAPYVQDFLFMLL